MFFHLSFSFNLIKLYGRCINYIKSLPRFSSAAKHMGYMISAIRRDTTETYTHRCEMFIDYMTDIKDMKWKEKETKEKNYIIILTCNGHAKHCKSIIFVLVPMILCTQTQPSENRRSDVRQKTHHAQGRSRLYIGCKVKQWRLQSGQTISFCAQ